MGAEVTSIIVLVLMFVVATTWRTRAEPGHLIRRTGRRCPTGCCPAPWPSPGTTRTPRDFDVDGPHVITGPVFVEGAEPGDVLKIETLSAVPRVPYGVGSSRGTMGAAFTGCAAADFTVSQVVDRTVGVHGSIPQAHLTD